jgi:hypothetical protein
MGDIRIPEDLVESLTEEHFRRQTGRARFGSTEWLAGSNASWARTGTNMSTILSAPEQAAAVIHREL